jgi:hypothetical protein
LDKRVVASVVLAVIFTVAIIVATAEEIAAPPFGSRCSGGGCTTTVKVTKYAPTNGTSALGCQNGTCTVGPDLTSTPMLPPSPPFAGQWNATCNGTPYPEVQTCPNGYWTYTIWNITGPA